MKLDNYKTIKKSEWQEIATTLNVEYAKEDVVRILLEKIAIKLALDFRNVSDNDLKKEVAEKINEDFELILVDEEESVIEESIVEESVIEESIVEEPVIEEPAKVELSRIEQLRLECESFGIAWSEGHTEQNLEQVLNAVKNSGVQPSAPVTKTINANVGFEISTENVNEVANEVNNAISIETPTTPVNSEVKVNTQSQNHLLENFANIYLNTIRHHFRLMTIPEIDEMIKRDKEMFSHTIKTNPQQSNRIEIILTQNNSSVRIPLNNSEWIDING
jgi:hypothetical protein